MKSPQPTLRTLCLRPLCLLLLAASLCAPARAQQTFTNEDDFFAATGALGSESFECLAVGDPSGAAPIVTPVFTMTIEPALHSSVAPMGVQAAPDPAGPHATDGAQYVQAGATASIDGQFDLTFTFADPIQEFAFHYTDFGDAAGLPGTLSATVLGVTYTIATDPPALPDGSERFWGMRTFADPFTTVVLHKSTQGDGLGLDEVFHTDIGLPGDCQSPWSDLGFAKPGSAGTPKLTGLGMLAKGSANELVLASARPLTTATLAFGLIQVNAPFKGGTFVPQPLLLIPLSTDAFGGASLLFTLPASAPLGTPLHFQFWIVDPAASDGFSASNGLLGETS